MKPAKVSGTANGFEQSAGRRRCDVREVAHLEVPHLAAQPIGRGEVEAAPQHIHPRGRKPFRRYVIELTASGKRMRERVETARNGVIRGPARVLDENDAENFERIAAKILAAFGNSSTDS